jgi:hypothetical protein
MRSRYERVRHPTSCDPSASGRVFRFIPLRRWRHFIELPRKDFKDAPAFFTHTKMSFFVAIRFRTMFPCQIEEA